jgi:hypothetical protein
MEYVKTKIDETYQVALKLGLNGTDIEKKIFKDMLYQIAVSANDETRHAVNEILYTQSDKYTGGT